MSISDGRQVDIWVYDWERDILTRVTTDPAPDLAPVWTPDGTALVYGSARGGAGTANLYWQRADGTGAAELLTTSDQSQLPDSFDPEGKVLVFHEGDPTRGRQQLGMLPLERGAGGAPKAGTTSTLIGGPFLKANARISPDGKWMAYSSNDSGPWEIYVQPFPALGERVQVSSGGGNLAVWSRTKNELFYAGPNQARMMVVPYTVEGGAFRPSKPQAWSQTMFSATPPVSTYGPAFDLHPDGTRFAVTPPAPRDDMTGAQLVLLFNFFDELRRVAPPR
jgi:Tol biopolymer transport system component